MPASSPERDASHDFAITICIRDYPRLTGVPPLENAVLDGDAVEQWLLGPAGIKPEHLFRVRSIADDPDDPIPQQYHIDRAFGRLFRAATEVGGGQRLYLYYSGHGAARAIQHTALLTAGWCPTMPDMSLDAVEYHDALALLAVFREQVLFYDCCRSFDLRIQGRGPDWYPATIVPGAEDVNQWIYFASGLTEFANSRRMEYSGRRGLFTRALLEGLQGAAIVPGSQVITTRSLAEYISARIEKLVLEEGVGRQRLNYLTVGPFRDVVLPH
jgi:hypothetical protein